MVPHQNDRVSENRNPSHKVSEKESLTPADREDSSQIVSSWHEVDFSRPNPGEFPADWEDDKRWMTSCGKKPFAPWGDRDDPDIACTHPEHDADTCRDCNECDGRWKWSNSKLWTTLDEAKEWQEMHPKPDGLAVLIDSHDGEYTETGDEYAFADGDNVRCPDTGEVHPAFLDFLDRLGLSYADISTSGTGVHAPYRGKLPEAVNKVSFEIDDEPWGTNDEPPTVEIFDQKHVCVTTGNHVPGTGERIAEWDDDELEKILIEELGEEALAETPSYDTDDERPQFDLEDYEPKATKNDEETSDIRDVFTAIDRLKPADLNLERFYVGEDSTGWTQWNPVYRPSDSKSSLHSPDKRVFFDHDARESFGVLGYFAAVHSDIDCKRPWRLEGATWWRAVEEARQLGAEIPAYVEEDGPDDRITTCEPPVVEREALDIEARWDAMQEDRYDEVIEHDAPTIWGDEAGTGKTTNAALAAYARGREHAVLFQQHKKAAEFLDDDATPSAKEYYHMLGAEQKRQSRCRRADWDDDTEVCPKHNRHLSECGHMCPVYDLDPAHPVRRIYDYVERNRGPIQAHVQLREILPGHDEEGCLWEQQFDDVKDADYVVGVHEYLRLDTITAERDVIVDEAPSTLQRRQTVSVEDLTRFKNASAALANLAGTEETHQEIARFTGDIIDALTDPTAPDTLAELEPPRIPDPYRRDLGDYERENDLDQRASTPHPVENLARAKLEYCETMLQRVDDAASEINETDPTAEVNFDVAPMLHDAIFATAVKAGLNADVGLAAAAAPETLTTCPTCGTDLIERDGQRVCPSEDCGWTEQTDLLVHRLDYAAKDRRMAYLKTEKQDPDEELGLVTLSRPRPETLPQDPLILNATSRPRKVASIWEIDPDRIRLDGNDPVAANMNVTQVINGQFHPGTVGEWESLQQRFQQAVDNLAAMYTRPLIVGPYDVVQRAHSWLDVPENAEVMHFHAARGFNRSECDAVIAIGAPHPPVDDLRREAELLAVQNNDIRVGGTEHGPRDGAEGEPIWRKLDYEDDQGKGRAVKTKTYTGLVGTLFREHREDELEQIVHRVRPVLAEDTKHVYLLTNVPTELPVDDVVRLDELTDGIRATLDIPDAALDLAELIHHAASDNIDGVRPGALLRNAGGTLRSNPNPGGAGHLVEVNRRAIHRLATMPAAQAFVQTNGFDIDMEALDVSYKTITRWVDALERVGLLSIGEYVQQAGERLTVELSTLTSALEILSNSENVKVAVLRKLRRLHRDSDSATAWIAAARELFGLTDDAKDGLQEDRAALSGGETG